MSGSKEHEGAPGAEDPRAGRTRGVVIWLTGRPAAGKSTLARAVRDRLHAMGRPVCVLDSDDVRAALLPAPGYDEQARLDFYTTLGRLAGYLAGQGLVVLVPATAHRRVFRDRARAAAPAFLEVYVSATSEQCARRDVKGLYAGVRSGQVRGLPGGDALYEEPEHPEVVAAGGHDREAAERIVAAATRTP